MASPKRDQLQQQGCVFPSSCKKKLVPIVRHIETVFVETDVANFKAVVQSLIGHQQTSQSHDDCLGFLNNVNVFPPLFDLHAIHEIDNLVAQEVEIKDISFGVDNICTPMSFVGFESENHSNYDAFDLISWTTFDQDMSLDSFLLLDYQTFNI